MRSVFSSACYGAAALFVLGQVSALADFETDLLQKFQQQNHQAARQLKLDVEQNLGNAIALCGGEPEKALDLLRRSQESLKNDGNLSAGERTELLRSLEERVREAKARIKSKEEAAKDRTTAIKATIILPVPGVVQLGINTTVSVPDGGTVVVGGFKSSMEGRNEFGVPGLGKVPYLGRLGRNTSYGRQGTSVQINVSTRIIDLAEEDRRLLSQAPPLR
jgi:hypothetical protein